jgi:hypothetical protein
MATPALQQTASRARSLFLQVVGALAAAEC